MTRTLRGGVVKMMRFKLQFEADFWSKSGRKYQAVVLISSKVGNSKGSYFKYREDLRESHQVLEDGVETLVDMMKGNHKCS